jgi:serine/threonine protein phosphatase PrpC
VQALEAAATKTDTDFLRIARIRKRRDGCCAVAALFLANKLFVLNVGDSRAVLFKRTAPEAVRMCG